MAGLLERGAKEAQGGGLVPYFFYSNFEHKIFIKVLLLLHQTAISKLENGMTFKFRKHRISPPIRAIRSEGIGTQAKEGKRESIYST